MTLPTVTVVGGGPAGVAAAVWARRLGFDAVVLEAGERLGGALWRWTEPVLDLPGWSGDPAALAASYARHLERLGVEVVPRCRAVGLAPGMLCLDGGTRPFQRLVIATGTRVRVPDLPLPPPPAHFEPDRTYAVIGGGDGAAFAAHHALESGSGAIVLYRGRLRMQPRLRSGLRCRRARVLACEPCDGRWRLHLAGGASLVVDGVVVRLGYSPAAAWTGLAPADGRVPADTWGCTSLPGVYVVGDVSSRTPSARASLCNAYAQAMYAMKHLALHQG